MRAHLMTALFGLAFVCCEVPAARSDQLRIALVISNEEYASLPILRRCSASATVVRDALRGKGFKIIERGNLELTEFDSAAGALARRIAESPAALAVLYYCGYAQEFGGESFLLPTSATITRDYDVFIQGVPSKTLVDSLDGVPQSTGLVLLDVFPTPNAASTALGRLIEQITSSTFAVIGASNEGSGQGPTPASLALRDRLAEGEVNVDMLVVEMRRRLSQDKSVAAQFVPASGIPSSPAAGPRASPSPAPAPPAAPAASTAVPAEQPPTPASPAPPTAVPVQAAPPPPKHTTKASSPKPPPRQTTVEQPKISALEKRLIQTVLQNMGYYSGRIDGKFGPETRAAVRRYQYESKAKLTGRLNAEQASKLLCVMLCPPSQAQDDGAYCAELSATYQRYLDNAGESRHFPEVTPSVAMDECARGNTAAGIPVLEKKLRDGRLTPPRG